MNSDIVQGLIRHTLTLAGGYLVAKGLASDSMVNDIVGGVIALIGVIWSVLHKKQATPPK